MTVTVYATEAQRDAALAIVERSARTGKHVSESVLKIAHANGSPVPAVDTYPIEANQSVPEV